MPDNKIRWEMETLRTRAASTFTGSYQTLGSATLNKAVGFHIINNTNVDVTISNDGVHDKMFVPTGSFVLLDIAANCESNDESFLPAQTQFYVKGSAGTGSIYLEVYFQF
jgi:hypothetical protein